jgi:translation initiation factor 4E
MSSAPNSNKKVVKVNNMKLKDKFVFYYRISEDSNQTQSKQPLDKVEYESQVKKISEFDTMQDFWAIFQHLRKPDSCKPGIEFHMFKDPVKPMWEDENNKNGGKITIKLTKGYTTIIWEEMIFALIGEDVLPYDIKVEINGIVVTTKKEYNTLQIWIKNFETNINNKIELCIRDLLQIPPEVNLEFRQFNKNNKK